MYDSTREKVLFGIIFNGVLQVDLGVSNNRGMKTFYTGIGLVIFMKMMKMLSGYLENKSNSHSIILKYTSDHALWIMNTY